jgi:Protein of unknown function (DUF2652)
VVASGLATVGSLAKLEGDAVFVCDRAGAMSGEQLLAALDPAYAGFVRHRRTIALRTTGTCEACARIPALDLKFVAHHGEFIEHVVAGSEELLGPDDPRARAPEERRFRRARHAGVRPADLGVRLRARARPGGPPPDAASGAL